MAVQDDNTSSGPMRGHTSNPLMTRGASSSSIPSGNTRPRNVLSGGIIDRRTSPPRFSSSSPSSTLRLLACPVPGQALHHTDHVLLPDLLGVQMTGIEEEEGALVLSFASRDEMEAVLCMGSVDMPGGGCFLIRLPPPQQLPPPPQQQQPTASSSSSAWPLRLTGLPPSVVGGLSAMQQELLLACAAKKAGLDQRPFFDPSGAGCVLYCRSGRDANRLLSLPAGAVSVDGLSVGFADLSLELSLGVEGGGLSDAVVQALVQRKWGVEVEVLPQQAVRARTEADYHAMTDKVAEGDDSVSMRGTTVTLRVKRYDEPRPPQWGAARRARDDAVAVACASDVAKVVVVQDGQNCYFPPLDLSVPAVLSGLDDMVLGITGEGVTEHGRRHLAIRRDYTLVLPSSRSPGASPAHLPNASVRRDLQQCVNCVEVDAVKGDSSVDNKVKSNLQTIAASHVRHPGALTVVVLIAGDRDFQQELVALRAAGVVVVLVHANNAGRSGLLEEHADYVYAGGWLALVRHARQAAASRRLGGAAAAAAAAASGGGVSKPRPSAAPPLPAPASLSGGGGGGSVMPLVIKAKWPVRRFASMHKACFREEAAAAVAKAGGAMEAAAVRVETPVMTGPEGVVEVTLPAEQQQWADVVKSALVGLVRRLDHDKVVLTLTGVGTSHLKETEAARQLQSMQNRRRVSLYVPGLSWGAKAGEQQQADGGSTTAILVSDLVSDPHAADELRDFLMGLERTSVRVSVPDGFKAGFIERRALDDYRAELQRRFSGAVEVEMPARTKEVVLTGPPQQLAAAQQWVGRQVARLWTESVPVDRSGLSDAEVRQLLKKVRHEAGKQLRAERQVRDSSEEEGDEEEGDEDDDASSTASGGSGGSSRPTHQQQPRGGVAFGVFMAGADRVVCVGPKEHVMVARAKVEQLMGNATVTHTVAGLDTRLLARLQLETLLGRRNFARKHGLLAVEYEAKGRSVTVRGSEDDVSSAREELEQAASVTLWCQLPADGPGLLDFFHLQIFQRRLREAAPLQPGCGLRVDYAKVSKVKGQVVCIRGPKAAAQAFQAQAQVALDALAAAVVVEQLHLTRLQAAYLRRGADEEGQGGERLRAAVKKHGVMASFQQQQAKAEEEEGGGGSWSVEVRPGCVLEVKSCDVTEVGVECLVNAANTRLDHAGGIARALVRAGGSVIQQESDRLVREHGGVLKQGQVVVTTAGRMPGVKHVAHLAMPTQDDLAGKLAMARGVRECLQRADGPTTDPYLSRFAQLRARFIGGGVNPQPPAGLGCESIGLTLMGSGVYGWDAGVSATTLLEAIRDHFHSSSSQQQTSSSLRRVVVFDMDPAKARIVKGLLPRFFPGQQCASTASAAGGAATATASSSRATTLASSSSRLGRLGSDSSSRPQPRAPRRLTHLWQWNNAKGEMAARQGLGQWVAYDYDQCVQLEEGLIEGGCSSVHVTGDRMGQHSDTLNKDPETGRGEYVVTLEADGRYLQRNTVSRFERLVTRRPLADGEQPELYDKRVKEYEEDLARWRQEQQQRRPAAEAVARAEAGAGKPQVEVEEESKEVVLALTGFDGSPSSARREVEALLADAVMESSEPVALPAFVDVSELRADMDEVLRQHGARLMEVPQQGGQGKAIKVRVLGEYGLAVVERRLLELLHRKQQETVPAHWMLREARADEPVRLVELDEDSEEYQSAVRRLRRGFTKCQRVTRVERVENPRLYHKYVQAARGLAEAAGEADEGVEVLVHGTGRTPPVEVCGHDLGLSHNYNDRGFFGCAVYLAEDATYSDAGYAHTLPSGEKQLLLVEAALGRVEVRQVRTDADARTRHPAKGYHTVKGPVTPNHQAYMKYEHYHVYPTHIITYTTSA